MSKIRIHKQIYLRLKNLHLTMISLKNNTELLNKDCEQSDFIIIYPSTCRICLKEAQDLKPLFSLSNDEFESLVDKINYCTDLKLKENDEYPQNICKNCEDELETSLSFKKKCIESNLKLCNMKCGIIKSESEHVVCDETVMSLNYFQSEDDDDSLSKFVKLKNKLFKGSVESKTENIKKIRKKNTGVHLSENTDNKKVEINDSELGASYIPRDDGSFQCKTCGKTVSTKAAMINHFKSHTEPMNCPTCNKWFPTKKLCTRHYKNVHMSYSEACPVCGRSFKLLATLQTHLKTHSGAQPYGCAHCGRCFSSKHNMHMHVRGHLQLREFCCHLCGMAFVTPGALRFHSIRKHSKVRPFPCSQDGCSLSFAAKSELARHEATHSAAYKHTCDLCHKGFKRTDVYRKHMRKEHSQNNLK